MEGGAMRFFEEMLSTDFSGVFLEFARFSFISFEFLLINKKYQNKQPIRS
jgi:hypothetical protein